MAKITDVDGLKNVSAGDFIVGVSTIDDVDLISVVVRGDEEKVVAITGLAGRDDEAESIANAILFSLAKTMFEALQEIAKTAEEQLGEHAAVTKLYSPEWTHPYHDIAEAVDAVFEGIAEKFVEG